MRERKIGKTKHKCGQYHTPIIEAPSHDESNGQEDVWKIGEDRKERPHLLHFPHLLLEARPLPNKDRREEKKGCGNDQRVSVSFVK